MSKHETGAQNGQSPSPHQLNEAASKAEKAIQIHHEAEQLKAQAAALTDPAEQSRLLDQALKKELEAKGLSKTAQRLQSGYVQGAIGGAGIGAAVAGGVGTVVGTLVGGVLSIPTTAVGGLVGTGVGALHGPFISMPGKGKQKSAPASSNASEPFTVPDPAKLNEAANKLKQQKDGAKSTTDESKRGQRRELPPRADGSNRRKPRKLQVR